MRHGNRSQAISFASAQPILRTLRDGGSHARSITAIGGGVRCSPAMRFIALPGATENFKAPIVLPVLEVDSYRC
jgi:hypothetical protein